MTQLVDPTTSSAPVEATDLAAAIARVLHASAEPLTVAKIKTQLPTALRGLNVEEILHGQVAAKALHEYPKYRSPHARFWDRPMSVHVAALLRETLDEEPLAWSDLRRKLPAYAAENGVESILQEQLAQGRLFRHPRTGGRGGDRFSTRRPDPKDYLRSEFITLFGKLEQLGFTQAQLRAGATELLHEEEWASVPAPDQAPPRSESRPTPITAPPQLAPSYAAAPQSSTNGGLS